MNEQHRGDTGTPNLTPGQGHSGTDRRIGRQKFVLLALGLLALGTIFLLPRFVSEPWLSGEKSARAVTAAPTSSTVRPSTAAEKTRYRQQSQSVLAGIIAVRDRLLGQGVNTWADIEFNRAMQWVDEGDQLYSYGDYAASLEQFSRALELLTGLEDQAAQNLEQSLAEGLEAIESLNPNVATPARDLAVILAPENPDVQALDARLQTLPQVAALIEVGDEARARGKLGEAQQAYEQAVALDPAHNRAAESLSSIHAEVTDSQFRQHMSRGYAALDDNRFEDARAAFKEAAGIFPGHAAVAQALAQLENRDSQVTVTRQLQQAAALEAAERWQDAAAIYESLLEEDPSLSEVRARLLPTQVRAGLDEQLEAFAEDPLQLSRPDQFRSAQQLLGDARGISNPGGRLSEQIATLDRLLALAQSPVNVVFKSDNQTHVTLFRVAELGQFEQTTVTLRPGRYVAGGRRQGFRDVQVEFTITGEPLDEPIVVRCEESI